MTGEISKSKKRDQQRTLFRMVFYRVIRYMARICAVVFFRFHSVGMNRMPATGNALLCSNHQSNLDPALIGLACPRVMNYMARKTLFKSWFFRWLISNLDAIPIDRDGLGVAGIKESMKRLKRGEMVLIFPEGTRTLDGQLGHFKPGFLALARRNKAPLVPMALAGAFEAWPKGQKLPKSKQVALVVGDPIAHQQYSTMSDEDAVNLLRDRIHDCLLQASAIVARSKARI